MEKLEQFMNFNKISLSPSTPSQQQSRQKFFNVLKNNKINNLKLLCYLKIIIKISNVIDNTGQQKKI